MNRRIVGAVVLGLSLCGCGSARYESLQMNKIAGDGSTGVTEGLRVPHHRVLVIEAEPKARSGATPYRGLERLELESANESVAQVRRTIVADTWVVTGVEPGQTTLRVEIDGVVVEQQPIEVEASP